MRARAVVAALTLTVVATAFAQYALDRNLSRTGGRINPHAPKMQMSAPIYTVNRTTGQMQYNRANAFKDKTYAPYQRYTMDRQKYFNPQNTRINTAGTSGAIAAQNRSPQGYGGTRLQRNTSVTNTAARRMYHAPAASAGAGLHSGPAAYPSAGSMSVPSTRTSGLAATPYRPSRPAQPKSMASPFYTAGG